MEAQAAVLCDSASDYAGKLCILGAFDTIYAQRFPAVHAHCAVALRLICRPEDSGRHEIVLRIIDPDGNSLFPQGDLKLPIEIPPISGDAFFVSRNLVVNLQGLPIPKPAAYSVDAYVGGEILARIPFQVIEVDPKKGGQQQRPPQPQ